MCSNFYITTSIWGPKPLVLHWCLSLHHCIGRFLGCFSDTRELSPAQDELTKPHCILVVHFDSNFRTWNNHLSGLLITHNIIFDLVQSSKLYVELEMPVIGSLALMSKQVSLRARTQQCLWFKGTTCTNPTSISKNYYFCLPNTSGSIIKHKFWGCIQARWDGCHVIFIMHVLCWVRTGK